MVFINNKKFACESCIKGHRSSSCSHSERPLFEIKKKGRPVSQCPKCRELRATRKVHSKCSCNDEGSPEASTSVQVKRIPGKRFIPIVPALPNGLKDYIGASSASKETVPQDARSKVDSLLNPCTCKAFNCRCAPRPSTQSSIQAQAIALSRPVGGLKALAQAATELQSTPQASCCGGAAKDPVARSITPPNPTKPSKRTKYQHDVTEPSSCCTPAAPVLNPATTEDYTFDYPNSPLLPALDDPIFSPAPIATAHKHSTSDAMSCTCGATCSCPGCSEHRGTEHAHGKDCTGGSCSTCVDWHAGVALPEHTGFLSTSTASVEEDEESSNIFARFLRQAASLPEPPKSRVGLGPSLDPSHVPDFFAFGLKEERVAIPRLECCNGNCGCPDGTCGCGKTCDGCCTEHSKNTIKPNISKDKNLRSESPKASAEPEKVLTPRSCCAGK